MFYDRRFLLINVLLLWLLMFRLYCIMTRFNLTRFINNTQARTVGMLLIARLRLRTIRLRNKSFSFRLGINRLNLIIRFRLFRLMTTRLLFVRRLFMINFNTLRIRFRSKNACVRTITAFSMRFRGTNVSKQISGFLRYQSCLTKNTGTSFGHTFARLKRGRIFLLRSHARR